MYVISKFNVLSFEYFDLTDTDVSIGCSKSIFDYLFLQLNANGISYTICTLSHVYSLLR